MQGGALRALCVAPDPISTFSMRNRSRRVLGHEARAEPLPDARQRSRSCGGEYAERGCGMVRIEVVSGNGGIEAVALDQGTRLSIELMPTGEEMLLVFDRG